MNKNSLLFIAAIVAFFAMAGFLAFSGGKKESASATPTMPTAATTPTGEHVMIETRPLVPPSMYQGRVAEAYRIAEEIPGVIDQLYCYCKCKENPMFLHKTLLTCYTDNHASNCDICMHEAEMASLMTKEGKSPAEIRTAIDVYYQDQSKHEH